MPTTYSPTQPPLVAVKEDVTIFLQLTIARYIQTTLPERLNVLFPNAAQIDSLAEGLAKHAGLDGEEFKQRLFARLGNRKYGGPPPVWPRPTHIAPVATTVTTAVSHSNGGVLPLGDVLSDRGSVNRSPARGGTPLKERGVFGDKEYCCSTKKALLISILTDLANEDSTFLERFVKSSYASGKRLKYLAQTREEVQGGASSPYHTHDVAELPGGWFLFTHFSGKEIQKFIGNLRIFRENGGVLQGPLEA
jgi:hypothetical protein